MYSKLRIDGIGGGHVQGIAIDRERRYVYYSFTTCFIKTDMGSNVVGSVTGLVGHLGCLAYNGADGKGSPANFVSGLMKSVPPLSDLFDLAGMNLPEYLGKKTEVQDVTPVEEDK